MEEIVYKKTVVGLLLKKLAPGSVPVTNGKEPLQFVTLKHPKGKLLVAHTHAPKKRITLRLQECLIVKKGKIRIDLYAPDKTLFKKITLRQGQAFILQNGGYAIHILEAAELFEVKNGPFLEDKVLL